MKRTAVRRPRGGLDFLKIPQPLAKPRQLRWTILSDRGLPLRYQEDLFDIVGNIVDRVKYNDHVGLIDRLPGKLLMRKNALYHKRGLPTFPGGVAFEIAYLQNHVEKLFERLLELGFSGVEISSDSIPAIPPAKRSALIKRARALGLEVFTEVGNKEVGDQLGDRPMALKAAVDGVRRDLDAGATKVTIENHELAQYLRHDRKTLLKIVDAVGLEPLLFEIGPGGWPDIAVWLLQDLGPDVNVENIGSERVVHLEAMRRGLSRMGKFAFFANANTARHR
jgi:phosphosulfolactate synthase